MKTPYFIQSLRTKKIVSFIFLFFVIFSVGFLVHAKQVAAESGSLIDSQAGFADDNEIGDTFGEKDGPEDVRVIVGSIIKVILGFLGIIFVILLLLAGFKWMTAQGSDEKITEAMGQIKTAVIGLIIVLASYAIASFVIDRVRMSIEGY